MPGLRDGIRRDAALRLVAAALGLAGAGMVVLCTTRYGAGVSPDSAGYLSAARSLQAGQGFRCADGQMYTQWPPLFPTLLAGLGLFGISPAAGARLLNAVAFGWIVFLSGRLFPRCLASRELAILGTLSVLVSAPLLAVSIMVWSEPVFIVLTMLFLLCLPTFLRTGSRWAFVLVSLWAGLACLQRYAGVALIGTGSILILLSMSGTPVRRRIQYLAGFCVLSALPPALWLVRNRLLTGRTAGGHHVRLASLGDFGGVLASASGVMTTWLFPESLPDWVRLVGLGLVVALTAIAIVAFRKRPAERDGAENLRIGSIAVFAVVYLGFMALSGAGLSWIPEQRHMSPIYVPVLLLVFAGVDRVCRRLDEFLRRRIGSFAGVLLCILWLLGPLTAAQRTIAARVADGAGGYNISEWRQSPLMAWLQEHPMPGKIYSNVPDAIYLLTGTPAEMLPHYDWDAAAWADRVLASSQAGYVAWFDHRARNYLYDLKELQSRLRLEEVATAPDGKVYRLLGRGGSGALAVYRFWSPAGNKHLFTADKSEKNALIRDKSAGWAYEGVAFYTPVADEAGVHPVYCLRSDNGNSRFYTMSESEKDKAVNDSSDGLTCQGVAFHAYPEKSRADLLPVYCLRSSLSGFRLYTVSEKEKSKLMRMGSHEWTDEGVVWYAYAP